MWKYGSFKRLKKAGILFCCCGLSTKPLSRSSFNFRRVLIVSKMTRYEVEKYYNPDLNEEQLKRLLKQRGSDYDSLVKHHNLHKNYEHLVVNAFESTGVETRTVNKLNLNFEAVDECDAVIPVGGDGTFLLAASRVRNSTKPVIGLNSHPARSEGFLCLPKRYCIDVKSTLNKLLQGEFSWLFRYRIRVTLKGMNVSKPPLHLSEKEVIFSSKWRGTNLGENNEKSCEKFEESVLPYRALNEVFIGECLAARVSYFELEFPNQPVTKVKSSGLCICTGTGSSSWHFSMNRLNVKDAQEILKLAGISHSIKIDELVARYNDSLMLRPDDRRMVYTVRDLISAAVWPDPPGLPSRGFCDFISVHSKCLDAGLVIDGELLYPFNDGTVAVMEILPEDVLRTVLLIE
ncbi:NAD kinase 2, mitochondrial [Lycorma delicatula]|uniref:NAD kinase 2, mitochondrial n=1 Tax=Lycorma delicatula TaxID=130591 RepID=UPI003F50F339